MEAAVRRRIAQLTETAPGSIGDMLHFRLLDCSPEQGDDTMSCRTAGWMRNFADTLHGGLRAAVLDQAMGFLAYCLKPGAGMFPAVQLQVDYHRPLMSEEEVLVRVHVVSVTKSLMKLTAEAFRGAQPDKICLSGSGIFFYKPAQ